MSELLAENFRECLRSYQRAIIWSLTASFSFLLISLSLGEREHVQFLWGRVPNDAAWFLAMLAFFLFGAYANSCLNRATRILKKVALDEREDLVLYPSLATLDSAILRVGPIIATVGFFVVGFALELRREWGGWKLPTESDWWFGLFVFLVGIGAMYLSLAYRLREPHGLIDPGPAKKTES